MKRIRTRAIGLGLIVLLALVAAPARAQDSRADGWFRAGGYAAVAGMVVSPLDSDVEDPTFPMVDLEVSSDLGLGLSVAAGYRFGNGFRPEVELSYRLADFDELEFDDPTGVLFGFPAAGSIEIEGEASALSAMANVYYDFRTGAGVIPYLGLGIGVTRIDVDSDDLGDGDDTTFAYQGRIGLGGMVSPTVMLFGEYTYFSAVDPSIEGIDFDYATHTLSLGARFAF